MADHHFTDEYRAFRVADRSAKKNADKRGLTYALTREDVDFLWSRCGGKCEISGIVFETAKFSEAHARRPYAPSLDRISSQGDYTLDNVRVVCVAINLAMNNWGEDVLFRIAGSIMNSGAVARTRVKVSMAGSTLLPLDVRRVVNKKSIKYNCRVKTTPSGPDIHLGTFHTVSEAVAARLQWAREHKCARVLYQVYQWTKDESLIEEARSYLPLDTQAFSETPNSSMESMD